MYKRILFLTISILYTLTLIVSAKDDSMYIKFKGDSTKIYNIDDIRKVIFPTKNEIGIVPNIGEVVIYSLDDIARVLFKDVSEKNILYVDTNTVINESRYYDAVIIAEKGDNDIYLDVDTATITTDSVLMYVNEVGIAPRINIRGEGLFATNKFVVSRLIRAGMWTMISLPYDVSISDVTIDGTPAIVGENIAFKEYDGEMRAINSIEGITATGWKDKESGIIPANRGFAVAINAQNGDIQEIRFPSSNFVIDASSISLPLERHYSTVNKGADADWNFIGNPTLSQQEKEKGYSVYVYMSETNSYVEYSSQQTTQYSPFSSFFVQSQDDLTEVLFAQSITRNFKFENLSNDLVELSINGEDKLTLLLNEDADKEYVRNEDALYMPSPNASISQIYMIRNGVKMAVSEQPSFDEDVVVGYVAPKGDQTITVTQLPEDIVLVLEDKTLGIEELMMEGDSYEFNNTSTATNNRFVLKFTELTGVESIGVNSYQIMVCGNTIYVKGCIGGELVSLYSSTGAVLSQTKAQNDVTEIETLMQGVLMLKIDDKVYKVVKR